MGRQSIEEARASKSLGEKKGWCNGKWKYCFNSIVMWKKLGHTYLGGVKKHCGTAGVLYKSNKWCPYIELLIIYVLWSALCIFNC